MYQNILVAIDDSATSEKALFQAIELAETLRGRVRIITVIDLISLNLEGAFADMTPLWNAQIADGERLLNARLQAIKATIPVETKLLRNAHIDLRIPDLIEAEAVAWPADLIVIGTHGRRGVQRLLLGSVAEGLVRISTQPVLLVRGAERSD